MAGALITCPNCRSTLTFGQGVPANATLRCPLCTTTFSVRPAAASAPAPTPAKVAPTPPAPPPPGPQAPVAKAAPSPRRASTAPAGRPAVAAGTARSNGKSAARVAPPAPPARSRRLIGGVIVAALALLFLGGLAIVFWTQVLADRPTKTKDTDVPGPIASNAQPAAPSMPVVAENPTPPTPPTNSPPPEPKKSSNPAPKKGEDVDVADLPTSKSPAAPTPLPEPTPKPAPPQPAPPQPAPPQPTPPEPASKPELEPKGKEGPTVPIVIPGTPAAPGVTAARVDAAIARGVAFLKSRQRADGTWSGGPALGFAALCGLAMLECQVPANDPAVRNAAQYVRNNVGNTRQVYELSASILFLDRLGEKQDRELIRNLAMGLLAAQNPAGGWGYVAQPVYAVDPAKMQAYLRTHWPWDAKHPRPMTGAHAAKDMDGKNAGLRPVDMQKLPVDELLWNKWNPFMLNPGDNSNTQFALLALWAARRHDVPVECAALLGYQRYLKTQNADGGWGYAGPITLEGFPPPRAIPPGTMIPLGAVPPGFMPAGGMPGMGLPQIGPDGKIAPMGQPQGGMPPGFAPPGAGQPGIAPPGLAPPGLAPPGGAPPGAVPGGGPPGIKPPVMAQAGAGAQGAFGQLPMNPPGGGMGGGWGTNIATTPTMTCVGLLGLALGHGAVPADAKSADNKLEDPAIKRGLELLSRSVGTPSPDANARPTLPNLYLLWSIERVAMLYDLKTIGGKDWYGWGAQILLANQGGGGEWGGGGYTGATGISDTCFALLFLKRSNLMPDLTENLRLQMVIRDPGAR